MNLRQVIDLEVNPSSQQWEAGALSKSPPWDSRLTLQVLWKAPRVPPPPCGQSEEWEAGPRLWHGFGLLYRNSCWNLSLMQWLKRGGTLSGGTHGKWLASDCWQEGIIWSRGALEQADETVSPMSLLFPSVLPYDLSHKHLFVSSTGALCDGLDMRLPGELSREQHPFLRLPKLWTKQTLFP